ncbi:hypothetical protein VPH35_108844 [Triticum aestivum]
MLLFLTIFRLCMPGDTIFSPCISNGFYCLVVLSGQQSSVSDVLNFCFTVHCSFNSIFAAVVDHLPSLSSRFICRPVSLCNLRLCSVTVPDDVNCNSLSLDL